MRSEDEHDLNDNSPMTIEVLALADNRWTLLDTDQASSCILTWLPVERTSPGRIEQLGPVVKSRLSKTIATATRKAASEHFRAITGGRLVDRYVHTICTPLSKRKCLSCAERAAGRSKCATSCHFVT